MHYAFLRNSLILAGIYFFAATHLKANFMRVRVNVDFFFLFAVFHQTEELEVFACAGFLTEQVSAPVGERFQAKKTATSMFV